MEGKRNIIANNIAKLRQAAGMTQSELAEKLNYSDKAISKWERAESIPDITVLMQIAELFGVTLDYLTASEHTQSPAERLRANDTSAARKRRNHGFITGMSIILVWLVATLVFVILDITTGMTMHKLAFLYAVPVSLIVWLIFNSIWFNPRRNFLIISLLMWSLLVSLHLTLLPLGFNLWQLYGLGVPGQVIIVMWSMLKKD